MPCVFLFFRSIELALKSVLVHHGVPKHEIKHSLGHRISTLMSRVEPFTGLNLIGIQPEDRQLLDKFSEIYADKLFEYSDEWWEELPHLEDLQGLARRVCAAVSNINAGKACAD